MNTVKIFDADGTERYYGVEGNGLQTNPFIAASSGKFSDSPNLDAFGKLRVSNPTTLFDSKMLNDNQPLKWDDQEVSGAGTSSAFDSNAAVVTLQTTNLTAGKRVRQTFMRFNYQPGKSQLILMTGVLTSASSAGSRSAFGWFDDNNGIFLEDNGGTIRVVKRSFTTGAAVDTAIQQSAWNLDPMDGTGPSGITLDFTKTQILMIDAEWLGVGRVRIGFVIDGLVYYVHQFVHANVLTEVYMTTPNLPLRYEVENDGAGGAISLKQICSTVISEGGSEELGKLGYVSTGSTHLDANVVGTWYALLAIRLKSTNLDEIVKQVSVSALATTADAFEYKIVLDGDVAGGPVWSPLTNYAIEWFAGDTTNVVTNGTDLAGGFVAQASGFQEKLENALYMGSAIDGTAQNMILAVSPLSVNLDIHGSITFRQLS